MIDLKGTPYNLNDNQIEWVYDTLKGMTEEEKIGQLFCTLGLLTGKKTVKHLTEEIKIGGIMFRSKKPENLQKTYRNLQKHSKIPLLCAANLESGGSGACEGGTNFSMPMGIAATGSLEHAYHLGKIACREGAAVGCNWAFAPIVDIDMNFRNPITNLRTFGADPEMVLAMGKEYLRAAKEENVAVSIKHFPGDGVDERDQHLLTSINSLSKEEWMESYGRIYRELIRDGAQTVMVGHIAQPALVRSVNPKASVQEQYLPGSLSQEIVHGILREELQFNGLIVTDASCMLGFTNAMPREEAVPRCIANGCDMLLFNKSLDEDYEFMKKGVKNGIITPERLDEAVIRILATKAALHLPEKQKSGTLVPKKEKIQEVIACEEHRKWAKDCADKAITLVKDTQHLLPVSPEKTRRIYLNVIENRPQKNSPYAKKVKAYFEKEGFEVILRDRTLNLDFNSAAKGLLSSSTLKLLREINTDVAGFRKKYDLMVTVANLQTQSNASVVRLNWKVIMGMGDDAPWYTSEVPSLFISTANPYHLLDVPMMKTFINTYTGTDATLTALMDKLMGRSAFYGMSPTDPFCGHEDTRL